MYSQSTQPPGIDRSDEVSRFGVTAKRRTDVTSFVLQHGDRLLLDLLVELDGVNSSEVLRRALRTYFLARARPRGGEPSVPPVVVDRYITAQRPVDAD